jgi:hypothetical protein
MVIGMIHKEFHEALLKSIKFLLRSQKLGRRKYSRCRLWRLAGHQYGWQRKKLQVTGISLNENQIDKPMRWQKPLE